MGERERGVKEKNNKATYIQFKNYFELLHVFYNINLVCSLKKVKCILRMNINEFTFEVTGKLLINEWIK